MDRLMGGDPRQMATLAAEHLLRYPWAVWYFGDTVGFDSLLAATEITGDERFRAFAYGLTRGWLARSSPWQRYDYTAPGRAMVALAQQYGDDQLMARLLEWADWQTHLTRAGGQILVDPLDAFWVWVDCMQFQGPFFAALGRATGDERWFREADRFLLSHAEVLRDGDGLYSQIYDIISRETNGIHWGRGQGWAMLGLWQTYAALPDGWPSRERLAELLRDLVETMEPHQLDAGHWRTIVDDPDAGVETSTAAFYVAAAGPALRAGILEARSGTSIDRAWSAVESSLEPDGRYLGVSDDTLPGTPDDYKQIPVDVIVPWGQGPFLLALQSRLSAGI